MDSISHHPIVSPLSNPAQSNHGQPSKENKSVPAVSMPMENVQDTAPVHLSVDHENLNHYRNQIANIPEIRQERINFIKNALEQGTYTPSTQDLANKIIQEL